jgi:LPS export ABC transporter protein LptC
MSEAGASILRQSRSPDETRRAVKRWRRRSLLILFWRGALPTLILVGLVSLGVWAGVRTFAQLSPNANAGDIRMINPEFHGRDKKGLPYVITADMAVKDPHNPDHMALTEPRLTMQSAVHGEMKVRAHTGQYDEATKILNLAGDVIADTSKDEHFRSPTARADTQTDTVEGHDGVQMSSPLGLSSGSSYAMENKTGHVVLTGNVHTHLNPHGQQQALPLGPPPGPAKGSGH